jgi:hypothetical protein
MGEAKQLERGMRVRLKVRTITGWKGTATIIDPNIGEAIKDGFVVKGSERWDNWGGLVEAARHEWAVLRDQTPNPEHALAKEACR